MQIAAPTVAGPSVHPLTPPAARMPESPAAASAAAAGASPFTIGEFNVENFFPPGGNNSGDVQTTPAQYATKLTKLALAITGQLHSPDVIALEEVGSQRSLDDLLSKTDLGKQGYRSVLLPTNDKRGINVALLYKSGTVSIDNTSELTPAADKGVSTNGSGGQIDPSKLFARPPLVVNMTVKGTGTSGVNDAAAGSTQVQLVVNHLLAKLGGPKADPRRNAQGAYLGAYADQQLKSDPQRGVVLLGDFNTGYGEDAYKAMTTRADGTQRLFDTPALKLPAADRYTYDYKGEHDMLDHVLVSQNLADALTTVEIPHFDSADNHQHEDDASVADGVSDHDPVLSSFDLSKFGSSAANTPGTGGSTTNH